MNRSMSPSAPPKPDERWDPRRKRIWTPIHLLGRRNVKEGRLRKEAGFLKARGEFRKSEPSSTRGVEQVRIFLTDHRIISEGLTELLIGHGRLLDT